MSYDDSLTSHHSQVGFDRKVQVFDPKPERGNVIGQVSKFLSNPTQFDLCRPLISASQSTAVIFYSLYNLLRFIIIKFIIIIIITRKTNTSTTNYLLTYLNMQEQNLFI